MDTVVSELYDPKGARILLIDDEPANLKLFSLMLRSDGYRDISTVQDPREVVDAYSAVRPDLILLDINMPHMDGYQVMAALKTIGDPLPPPIVVLTAQSGEDFLLRALNAGATDFLSKPINKRELLARVNNILMAHLALRFMHGQNSVLELMVAQRTRDLRASRLEMVRRLGRASEYRDNETGQHILRMSHAAVLLAKRIGWSSHDCELLLNAAPLHDVGKIGIPDGILLKPGPLTEDERELMKKHAEIGADILGGSADELLAMARDIAIGHHEKWDGTGYPKGLSGFQIPEAARIVAIADVFDALTSTRPYKKPWSAEDALKFMNEQAGKHFDPTFMAHFAEIVEDVAAIRGRFSEPEPQPDHVLEAMDTR
jgi:putative two-component system response regulator